MPKGKRLTPNERFEKELAMLVKMLTSDIRDVIDTEVRARISELVDTLRATDV